MDSPYFVGPCFSLIHVKAHTKGSLCLDGGVSMFDDESRDNERQMQITYQWLSTHVSEMKEKFVSE